ncbi:MAG TPA: heme ABC exporter ATP-binding protein CcmA [Thermohalobaculum sp.]|nr:heme ABC exporter ATP-binding protein CcmA [Thermohalobaculum sp.]
MREGAAAGAGLEIEDLACRRGGRLVFRDVTLALAPGGAAELRGPNGVGKSSLIRQLAGLVPVAGGDARLGEMSLVRDPGEFQQRVAYAGHLDAVKPALTVGENLGVWASILGADPRRAEAALERFGIAAIAERPAAECSAGQKRRLGLARLMLAWRPLWLLDEPTVSLDRAGTALVAALSSEHRARGGMVLAATHVDLGLADAAVLEMTPPPAAAAEADPFLAGAWG